uniref:PH domain leucine-rich repeat-containing protein phosphatase 2 n=1 Tax=Paramormyrops kingsleyae TaxID=1676925 RepID=A0A3B3S265_9TELE|nr:PH domain leucine-rich repeat-containing protein phosphatase 1 [Paramormyrops kingsleyae]
MESAKSAAVGENRLERSGPVRTVAIVVSGSETGKISVSKLKKPGNGVAAAVRRDDDGDEDEDDDDGGAGEPASDYDGPSSALLRVEAVHRRRAVAESPVKSRGLSASVNVNSLLMRRKRLKRNLSAAVAAAPPGGEMRPLASASPIAARTLDGKVPLRRRHGVQLQPSDRQWVRGDLQRGCVHVHDRLKLRCLRPVLCTVDTTAGEIARRLRQHGRGGTAVRVAGAATDLRSRHEFMEPGKRDGHGDQSGSTDDRLGLLLLPDAEQTTDARILNGASKLYEDEVSPSDILLSPKIDALIDAETEESRHTGTDSCGLNSSSDVESGTFDDLSSGGRDSLSDGMVLGADAAALSPTEGLDPFGSSSDELDLDCPSSCLSTESIARRLLVPSADNYSNTARGGGELSDCAGRIAPCGGVPLGSGRLSGGGNHDTLPRPLTHLGGQDPDPEDEMPTLYVQLHGEAARRLEQDEKPLQIQNDYLFRLGFKDAWRVQEEGMDTEIGCLIRFYAGKPNGVESSERVQLSGTYTVRKGKMQLPVNRWTRRQVILCGTCLIVSSVKDSQVGKMHVLPLLGGKVEEVKKHSHCLAFSSSGPQSQTYYVNLESFTEHLRWQRQAAKMVSQRISSVDLSGCSLERLPHNLFYSQDLTHLNLKHNFMAPGKSLTELQRFSKLRSLNLSSNRLGEFPLAICDMSTLTEVNLSCNYLSSVPCAIGAMRNLQALLLDGNCLSVLPAELGDLPQLSYLGLSFNEFCEVPVTLERLVAMERLCMAGNRLASLPLRLLRRLRVKHVDLRLNRIREVIVDEPDFLEHVTHLDLRDNRLTELNVMSLPMLEVLHCERNHLASLRVGGAMLKGLYASANELSQLEVHPIPDSLTYMDVSRNRLESLPEWLSSSKRLETLDIRHNLISELPCRLFCSSSLRKLLAGHNVLCRLPERLECTPVEVLDVQHNQLTELPSNLFLKADSLRCLNASANQLESLPPACLSEENRSALQELYLTNNRLTDKCVPLLTGHCHLRVLHLAYNQLNSFAASKMAKLEELEEVDLSGNRLKALPTTILNCRRMHTVLAHSNCIEVFPEVMQLMEVKCVDLACNELSEVTLPENLPPKLQELDLTGNPRLSLDHKTLELLNNIRCFRIDPSAATHSPNEGPRAPAVWSHGYAEASGVKNRPCVAALSVSHFRESREALFGVFDGDRNVEVPYLLQCTMSDVLAEELHRGKSQDDYMGSTFLVMQRKLGTAGQKLGGSAALCHIRHDPAEPGGCFTLTAANVGKCQAVLCRDGKPLPLSEVHNVGVAEEYHRVRLNKAIVTEDNKVNGVTDSTRIMGYSFLYPSVIPRPHVQTVTLTARDEFFVLGSRGLWESVSPAEAVEAVRSVPDALAAAKKLCTLAQAYGCSDSLSAVVVQLSVAEDCCCCCCRELPAPPSPSLFPAPARDSLPAPPTPSPCSEASSEVSASEMSSEVGSTASDELQQGALSHDGHTGAPFTQELRGGGGCTLHPVCPADSFQRQLSSATFSSALSDNGLDSEDEEPIAGVFSNGSRVEVEADVHCLRGRARSLVSRASADGTEPPSGGDGGGEVDSVAEVTGPAEGGDHSTRTMGRRRANGSVAPQERSHNLIEVVADAPAKKSGGYFAAPAQLDPDDQFIIPPELEEEVKEIMKQQQQRAQPAEVPPDYYNTPL